MQLTYTQHIKFIWLPVYSSAYVIEYVVCWPHDIVLCKFLVCCMLYFVHATLSRIRRWYDYPLSVMADFVPQHSSKHQPTDLHLWSSGLKMEQTVTVDSNPVEQLELAMAFHFPVKNQYGTDREMGCKM